MEQKEAMEDVKSTVPAESQMTNIIKKLNAHPVTNSFVQIVLKCQKKSMHTNLFYGFIHLALYIHVASRVYFHTL